MIGEDGPAVIPTRAEGLLCLVRKDWAVFSLRGRISVFGIFILAALQVLYVDELFLLLGVLLAATVAVYVPTVEWFQETDPMLHSLPIDRNLVVLSRYLTAVLGGLLAGVVWNAAGRMLLPLLSVGRENPAMWMTLEGILTFVLAAGLMVALFFPLYFGLGMGRGALAFLLTSVILLMLAYATAGLAWGPAVGSADAASHLLAVPPSALIRTRLSALISGLGVAETLTLVLVALALAFYASIRLSEFFFRKREF